MKGLRAGAGRVLLSFVFRFREVAPLYGERSRLAYQKVSPTNTNRRATRAASRPCRRSPNPLHEQILQGAGGKPLALAGRAFRSYFKGVIDEERLGFMGNLLSILEGGIPPAFVSR